MNFKGICFYFLVLTLRIVIYIYMLYLFLMSLSKLRPISQGNNYDHPQFLQYNISLPRSDESSESFASKKQALFVQI